MDQENISFIIVHKGDSYYLPMCLKQLLYTNPDSPVYVIGTEDQKFSLDIQHFNYFDFYSSAEQFVKIYKHFSTNSHNYELFCFLRWFIIRDFVIKKNIDKFICLDSDVLLFENINNTYLNFYNLDLTVNNKNGPQYSFFTKDSIVNFTDFIMDYYTNKISILEKKYEEYKTKNKYGGICDMTLLEMFSNKHNIRFYDTSIEKNNFTFNSTFYSTNKILLLKKKYSLPFYFKENGEKIFFYALHFQGSSKMLMHRFCTYKMSFNDLLLKFKREIIYIIFSAKKYIKKLIRKDS